MEADLQVVSIFQSFILMRKFRKCCQPAESEMKLQCRVGTIIVHSFAHQLLKTFNYEIRL